MAEEQSEEAGPVPDERKSRALQLLVMVAVILIGQAATGYVLVTRVFMPKMMDGESQTAAPVEPAARPVVDIEAPLLFPLDDLIVNPPDPFGQIRFLTAKVILKLDTAEALAGLVGLKASKVRDRVLTTLGSTTYQDMDDAPEREALREKVKQEINASGILEQGEVTAVYFERFIMQ